MNERELLPCPHCGGEALMQEQPPHTHAFVNMPDHPGSWTIECPACGNGMINDTRDEVVARWNRRATLASQPAQPQASAVYAVPTDQTTDDGKHVLYTITDNPIPLADNWKLYTAQPQAEPDQALLISMAVCLHHGFGTLGPEQQQSMLRDMRKLWDEVHGQGYYSPENRERYLAMLNDTDPLAKLKDSLPQAEAQAGDLLRALRNDGKEEGNG